MNSRPRRDRTLVSPGAETAQDLSAGRTLGLEGGLAVLVVTPPDHGGDLCCDGEPLVNRGPSACSLAAWTKGANRLGQRYTDPVTGLIVVCTLAGDGALTFAGRTLETVDRVPALPYRARDRPGPASRTHRAARR